MLTDREAIMDALYRFGAGVDTNDRDLLATAFTAEAVIDFSPCGRKMGFDFPVLTGAKTIVHFLGANAEAQITSHLVSNGRVHLKEERAKVQALVDATHILRTPISQRCQMRNWYEAELVEVEDRWRICRLTIENVWLVFAGQGRLLPAGPDLLGFEHEVYRLS